MRFALLSVVSLFALGCGSGPTPDKKDTSTKTEDKKGTASPSVPTTAEDLKASGTKFVTEFFATLKSGKATPDQLTDDFKKAVAPPLDKDDTARGFSNARAQDYLAKFATVTAEIPTEVWTGESVFAGGKPGPNGRYLLRVVRDGTTWKADWLSNGPPTASPVSLTGGEDVVGILFATAAFADAAMKKDSVLAAAAMSATGRAKVAPKKFAADEAVGYNRNDLRDEIAKAIGKATGFSIAGKDHNSAASTGKVTLALSGDPMRKELVLNLVRGTKPGVWLIDGWEVK